MIQQPELGKRIADLRKAKGLTQEELVEKCNLNVRTLQRIESGEATPRPYTLKLILEALEYSFEKSQEDKELIVKWLEQFYIRFTDLFNLKTNTMKKITILTTMLSGIVFGLFTIVLDGEAQDRNDIVTTAVEKGTLTDTNQPDSKIRDGYFSYEGSFHEDDELIACGVEFYKGGIGVKAQLMKLNTKTGKFNVGFVNGYFHSNKIEAYSPEAWEDRGLLQCEAKDSIVYNEECKQAAIYGRAKLISTNNEYLEANEIIVHFK